MLLAKLINRGNERFLNAIRPFLIIRYKKWICLIILFFYVYSPIFIGVPFGTTRIVVVWGLFILTIKRQWLNFYKCSKSEIVITLLILLYTLIWIFLGGSTSLLKNYAFNIFQIFATSYIIVFYFSRSNISIYSLIHLGGIAAIISTIIFISPEVYGFVNSITREPKVVSSDITTMFRGYALSIDKFFTFSVVQGICLAITIHSILVLKKYRFIVYVPFIILSIIANARIGFVPLVIYFFLYIFKYFNLKRLAGVILFAGLASFLILNFGSKRLLINIRWATSFFEASFNFLTGSGKNVGHFDLLFGRFIFFPKTLAENIFGTGINVFDSKGMRSDVGYVIQIYYGGIVFILMLLILNIVFFKKFQKYAPKDFSFFGTFFLLVTLICNIKGYFWNYNLAITYFYLILMVFYHQNYLKPNKKDSEVITT